MNNPITWLEDPKNYTHIRKGTFEYNKRILTTSIVRRSIRNISKLIGYQLIGETNNYYQYNFTIYYLKSHDNNDAYKAYESININSLDTSTYIPHHNTTIEQIPPEYTEALKHAKSLKFENKWFIHPRTYPFASIHIHTDKMPSNMKVSSIIPLLPNDSLKPIGYIHNTPYIFYLSSNPNTIPTNKIHTAKDKLPITAINPLHITWLSDPIQYPILYEHHIITSDHPINIIDIPPTCIGYRTLKTNNYRKQYTYALYLTTESPTPINPSDLIQDTEELY